ncbi:hypothetical protein QQ045_007751 [Rhodiola kirilowii]
MVLLEKLWDELVDRSETNCRLAGLRKITTPPLIIITTAVRGGKCKRNRSVAACSAAAVTPTSPVCKDSIFPAAGVEPAGRSFFHKTQPSGLSTMGFIAREVKKASSLF